MSPTKHLLLASLPIPDHAESACENGAGTNAVYSVPLLAEESEERGRKPRHCLVDELRVFEKNDSGEALQTAFMVRKACKSNKTSHLSDFSRIFVQPRPFPSPLEHCEL